MVNSSTGFFSLESYGYNLTQLAREEMFPSLKGYEAVITRIFDVLRQKEKAQVRYNPLLLDEDENLKLHIVMEVVRRLAIGDAPDSLQSLHVIAPKLDYLCGNFPVMQENVGSVNPVVEVKIMQMLSWPSSNVWSMPNEFLPKFHAFFSAACREENQVLLLFNDFHRLVGGDPQPHKIDLAPLLTPMLARRQIQLLALSTLSQYQQHIERDAGIERRLRAIALRSDEEIELER